MSPHQVRIQKPRLSRKILEENEITFSEEVCDHERLPKWVQHIREQVTSLRCRLPEGTKSQFNEDLEAFLSSGYDSEEGLEDLWSLIPIDDDFGKDEFANKIETELDDCVDIMKEAKDLRETNVMEADWVHLLRTHVFKTFHKVHGFSGSFKNTLGRWELHQDLHWNAFLKWDNMNLEVQEPTGPKPDLTYAFPIIDTTSKRTAENLSDPHVENFSLPNLSALLNRPNDSVLSAPTTSLRRWSPRRHVVLGAADLICFPWAIVEVKTSKTDSKSKSGGELVASNKAFCYCQAANASASALALREKLASRSEVTSPSEEALVIFAFTCVGPTVKLWTTYRGPDGVEMQCVWATSLELRWGVLALRMVIKNIREWVYGRVRPEISRWIRMVRGQPSPQIFLTPGGDTSTRTRRAVSCEPPDDRLDFESPASPSRGSRSKVTPTLQRGKTVPDRMDGCSFEHQLQVDLPSSENEEDDSDGEEEEEDSEGSADYNPSGEEEDVDDTDDEDMEISASELDDLELREDCYPDPIEDNGKHQHEAKGAFNQDDRSVSEGSDSEASHEDHEDSEGESYYNDEQRYPSYRDDANSRGGSSPRLISSGKKSNKTVKVRTPRPGVRRRSSHF